MVGRKRPTFGSLRCPEKIVADTAPTNAQPTNHNPTSYPHNTPKLSSALCFLSIMARKKISVRPQPPRARPVGGKAPARTAKAKAVRKPKKASKKQGDKAAGSIIESNRKVTRVDPLPFISFVPTNPARGCSGILGRACSEHVATLVRDSRRA